MNLALLIICHLIVDFLLQNDWMQRKSKDSCVCFIHVLVYGIPFFFSGIHPWMLVLIQVEHFLQDRFALHLKWMKFYKQTPPEKWSVGPLCIDQAMHLAFIGIVW